MKNTNFQYGYDVVEKDGVLFLLFDEKRFTTDEYIKMEMKYSDFKTALLNNGYDVIQGELYYQKTLRGSLSEVKYDTELDALIDCYYHLIDAE